MAPQLTERRATVCPTSSARMDLQSEQVDKVPHHTNILRTQVNTSSTCLNDVVICEVPTVRSSSRTPKRSTISFPLSKRTLTAKSERHSLDSSSLDRSLTHSAPTILVPTLPIDAIEYQPVRSIMTSRTIHESLHRGHQQSVMRHRSTRTVNFHAVNIREYERVLGDNPSVSSGPPLSLGWRYVPEPIKMNVDDYESIKGSPRVSAEFLVPREVREQILRDHADVSRRDMAAAVRNINRQKQQRWKTVANLSTAAVEEKLEIVKRKVQKVVKVRESYGKIEARLWDEAHVVATQKAKRLEECIKNGEKLRMREVYEVGTPCNNVLPSLTDCPAAEQMTMEESLKHSLHSQSGVLPCKDELITDVQAKYDFASVTHSAVASDHMNEGKDQKRRFRRRVSLPCDGDELCHSQKTPSSKRIHYDHRLSKSDSNLPVLEINKSEILAWESDIDDIFSTLCLDQPGKH